MDFIEMINTEKITWDSAKKQRFLDDFCKGTRYQESFMVVIDNEDVLQPNPISKTEHANNQIISYITGIVRNYRKRQDEEQAYSRIEQVDL